MQVQLPQQVESEIVLEIPTPNTTVSENKEENYFDLEEQTEEEKKPNQTYINQLCDVNSFEDVKNLLEETNKQFNKKIMNKNSNLKKIVETIKDDDEEEEIFVMEELGEKRKDLEIPKLELQNIKRTNSDCITTEDDSLFESHILNDPSTEDDLEDLLGTPLKLRSSIDDDLNNVQDIDDIVPWSETRQMIFNEMLQTERSYVKTLKILLEKYVIPSKKFLSISTSNSIFGDVEMILGVNEKFLEKLEKLEKIENQEEKELEFSCLLKNYFITFKLYVNYISNYNQSQMVLRNSILKNSKFHRFLQTVRTELITQRYRMQTLNSYLISPIQRLPR